LNNNIKNAQKYLSEIRRLSLNKTLDIVYAKNVNEFNDLKIKFKDKNAVIIRAFND
tara:strand:- start:342 stop:509 length:168 start_codon:yes stop_codon:yes gene_type:complete